MMRILLVEDESVSPGYSAVHPTPPGPWKTGDQPSGALAVATQEEENRLGP